jgi:site-specific recombinase XerD
MEVFMKNKKKSRMEFLNVENLIERYIKHLIYSLGLSSTHVKKNASYIRKFLLAIFVSKRVDFGRLRPQDIRAFILSYVYNKGRNTGQRMVSSLRSFFKFLKQAGLTIDFSNCLPVVPLWKRPSYQKTLSAKEIKKLLISCNRHTYIGIRDYAVLILMSKLGLRACEICSITLDDISWFTGEIIVRGKGRENKLPISQEIGEALVEYLRTVRPDCHAKPFFLCCKPPLRGLKSSTVRAIIISALRRAGLVVKGANLLRHSFATLLRLHGATLADIGVVLGHKNISTTLTYTCVDVEELRTLTLPWPLQHKNGELSCL